jgi:hypothetical protein
LGIWQESVVWPVLWAFQEESVHETQVAKQLLAAAEEVLGPGFIRHRFD